MASKRQVWVRWWVPGILAWIVTCMVPTAFDLWAVHCDPERPTQSRTLGHFLAHPVIGPVLAGIFCGLGYHLLVNEALICWSERTDVGSLA
jgi:hypothetical protein